MHKHKNSHPPQHNKHGERHTAENAPLSDTPRRTHVTRQGCSPHAHSIESRRLSAAHPRGKRVLQAWDFCTPSPRPLCCPPEAGPDGVFLLQPPQPAGLAPFPAPTPTALAGTRYQHHLYWLAVASPPRNRTTQSFCSCNCFVPSCVSALQEPLAHRMCLGYVCWRHQWPPVFIWAHGSTGTTARCQQAGSSSPKRGPEVMVRAVLESGKAGPAYASLLPPPCALLHGRSTNPVIFRWRLFTWPSGLRTEAQELTTSHTALGTGLEDPGLSLAVGWHSTSVEY